MPGRGRCPYVKGPDLGGSSVHLNLSYPGSAGPEGAQKSESARISEYFQKHA